MYEEFRVTSWLPIGKSGNWEVRKDNGITLLDGNGVCWMSDQQKDIEDNQLDFLSQAKGKVLINGLGIGMVAAQLAQRNDITSIDIYEKSQDVINLIAPYLTNTFPKVKVYLRDALISPPSGKKWDCAWHDIWLPPPTQLQIDEIKKVYEKVILWQMCWKEHA